MAAPLKPIPRPPRGRFAQQFEPLYNVVEDQRRLIAILRQRLENIENVSEIEPTVGWDDPGFDDGRGGITPG